MNRSLNIKKESPLDCIPPAPDSLMRVQISGTKTRWVPSRFNARILAGDGSVVIWNTKSGAISVFRPEQKAALEELLSKKRGLSGDLTGLAKYLEERGYLVKEDENEYRQFQVLFGQQHFRSDILELILLASEDCNFRCRYCYEDFKRGTMPPWVRDAIKKLVEKRASALRCLGISWFGGEPLYGFKAIEDLAPFFSEITDRYSLQYSGTITTNGYLLSPEVAEKLLAWKVTKYQITIDGPPEQHDHNRPARDGEGTFETIFSNLKALKKMPDDFLVRLRVNFDKENHPHLEKLLALIQDEFSGDPRFSLAFCSVGKWGGPNDSNLDVCGANEASHVRNALRTSALDRGLYVGTLADGNRPGNGVCYAARPFNFVIGADGKLMKCTVALDKQDHNVVGTLSHDGELVLDDEKYSLWVEPAFEGDAGCHKCHVLPFCQGISCPLVRIEEAKSPCNATIKPHLRNELLAVVEAKRAQARMVRVISR